MQIWAHGHGLKSISCPLICLVSSQVSLFEITCRIFGFCFKAFFFSVKVPIFSFFDLFQFIDAYLQDWCASQVTGFFAPSRFLSRTRFTVFRWFSLFLEESMFLKLLAQSRFVQFVKTFVQIIPSLFQRHVFSTRFTLKSSLPLSTAHWSRSLSSSVFGLFFRLGTWSKDLSRGAC